MKTEKQCCSLFKKCFLLFLLFTPVMASAADKQSICAPSILSKHIENVLSCFIESPGQPPASWTLTNKEKMDDFTIFHYDLSSQFWPSKAVSNSGNTWHHRLEVIVPDQIKNHQSLLVVTGGKNREENYPTVNSNILSLNLKITETDIASAVAMQFGSVVGLLKDVPNQFLTFDDGVPRKEDGIIAYSWNRYMDNPTENYNWPAHLPMAKSAVSAMDLIQQEASNQGYQKPTKFIVSGASKRGWTTWLAALADERVNAIIPMVIDIFNAKQNLLHIHDAYNAWPSAFEDYESQGVTNRINTPEFDQLMKIEDPLSYMNIKKYKDRLSIPKLIISASSDEFFPPDSLLQYIDKIPGDNSFYMAPNQSHHVQGSLELFNVITNFYQMILDNAKLPQVSWIANNDNRDITITTDFIPTGEVKLWQAYNPEKRDFRIETTNVKYKDSPLEGKCDQLSHSCQFTLPKLLVTKGYTSSFLEFNSNDGEHKLTTSSPAFIASY